MADEVRMIDKDKLIKKINAEIDAWAKSRMCMTADELLETIEEFEEEAEPDNGWISVKDRLPPTGVPVLIYVYNIEEMTVVSLDHDGLGFSNADEWFNIKNIHHWRPLPEPPKGK